jgi:hypothetical protein
MSRKNCFIATTVLWLLLNVSMAFASTISFSFEQSCDITEPSGVILTWGDVRESTIQGYAEYPVEGWYAFSALGSSGGFPGPLLSGSVGPSGCSFTGTGPAPLNSNSDGYLGQSGSGVLGYSAEAETAGLYHFDIKCFYSYRYQLDNSSGDPYYKVSWKATGADGSTLVNISYENPPGLPLGNIDSGLISGEIDLSQDIHLSEGMNYIPPFRWDAQQVGSTHASVPIGGTLGLLGSGLVWLAAYGRCRRVSV